MMTKDQEEVQPRSGEPGFRLDEDELREFSRGHLATYETPKRILRKDNLERPPPTVRLTTRQSRLSRRNSSLVGRNSATQFLLLTLFTL